MTNVRNCARESLTLFTLSARERERERERDSRERFLSRASSPCCRCGKCGTTHMIACWPRACARCERRSSPSRARDGDSVDSDLRFVTLARLDALVQLRTERTAQRRHCPGRAGRASVIAWHDVARVREALEQSPEPPAIGLCEAARKRRGMVEPGGAIGRIVGRIFGFSISLV